MILFVVRRKVLLSVNYKRVTSVDCFSSSSHHPVKVFSLKMYLRFALSVALCLFFGPGQGKNKLNDVLGGGGGGLEIDRKKVQMEFIINVFVAGP